MGQAAARQTFMTTESLFSAAARVNTPWLSAGGLIGWKCRDNVSGAVKMIERRNGYENRDEAEGTGNKAAMDGGDYNIYDVFNYIVR